MFSRDPEEDVFLILCFCVALLIIGSVVLFLVIPYQGGAAEPSWWVAAEGAAGVTW